MPSRPVEASVAFADQSVHYDQPDHGAVDNPASPVEEDDIYRGDPPAALKTPRPESVLSSSSSSSSSSSGSFVGGRLGAIATVVERAITRWARANWSTSSLTFDTSSTSSRSSFRTSNKSARRRKARSSHVDLRRAQSELEVAARIKAREERHYVSREFALYLPPSPKPPRSSKAVGLSFDEHPQKTLRTTDLQEILRNLEASLKRSSRRTRHANHHARPARPKSVTADGPPLPPPHQDYMLPDDAKSSSPKSKRSPVDDGPGPHQAWWLDVASPTWEDMRSIGKLLHLHPLTLEDILQQEPREKLELFPKLGYYFIVFRAIESVRTRKPFSFINKGGDASLGEEGIVGEVYVYLVVFKEGICTFHYSDISEHIEKVRNKVLLTENTITKSSAWIAHGILDSIVDAFFPFLEELEKEIVAIEDLVFSYGEAESMLSPRTAGPPKSSGLSRMKRDNEKANLAHVSPTDEKRVSKDAASVQTARTRFSVPRLTYPMALRRLKRNIRSALTLFPHRDVTGDSVTSNGNVSALKRMAKTRRLVTSLGRVLAMKSEVVARIRKRLLMSGEYGQLDRSSDDAEVAIYMGDVQDHILTLQQALSHYERMLSQSHPTHLLNLRVTVLRGRSSSDKAIMILTTVTVAILPPQTFIGLFSENIHVPRNGDGRYYIFGIIIVVCACILCAYFSLVRWWWVQAKRRKHVIL